MGDIALRGNKLTKGRGPHGHGPKPFLNRPGQAQGTHGGKAKGGRIGKFGGGRTDLLEELGRVEGERSNPNRRAEISRVHGELNRGYAKGGRAGFAHGTKLKQLNKALKKVRDRITHEVPTGPHTDVRRRELNPSFLDRSIESGRTKERKRKQKIMGMGLKNVAKRMVGQKEGGRIGFKKGTDKNWIQKATASIKRRKTKGKCTPITKPGCTGRAKALAKTFKKMAKKRKAA